jgi:hypothetical protein
MGGRASHDQRLFRAHLMELPAPALLAGVFLAGVLVGYGVVD